MRSRILALSFIFSFVLGQNYSLSFDGVDDYVDLANKPITGVQNEFSILSYFKTNSLSTYQGIYFYIKNTVFIRYMK